MASSRQSDELPPQPPDFDPSEKATPPVDLSFLKLSSNYHQLSTDDIPQAFLNSPNQPPQDIPLPTLLQHGHFRRAAGASLIQLSQCPPENTPRILQLFYTRLACLVLISRPDLATTESTTLTDYLARNPPGTADLLPLIPWELRLLLVRLQSLTAADNGRRGIMSLYSLTSEVRTHIKTSPSDLNLWTLRLQDLGLRVADALVEMGELETATRHLDTLPASSSEVTYRKALLRLRLGDIPAARTCIDTLESPAYVNALTPLLSIATDDLPQAIETYSSSTPSALTTNNLAVANLYTNALPAARTLLEEMLQSTPAFPGGLFNLCTIYELCSDGAGERKGALVEECAGREPQAVAGGWERGRWEFKL